MSTLYLLNYNNYYNRIVKTQSLAAYKQQAIYTAQNINFKPNDSCYTEQILNISKTLNPDYIVVTEGTGTNETLASRWFVLESKRTREGQYHMTLRRDVFADYNDIVKNATLFCEKGYVPDTDPLIFNPEGNTYNQIKTEEVLLKDSTGSAWIVGYCDNKLFEAGTPINITVNASSPAYSIAAATAEELLAEFPGSSLLLDPPALGSVSNVKYSFGLREQNPGPNPLKPYYNLTISPGSTYAVETAYVPNNTVKSVAAMIAYLPLICPDTDELSEALETDLSVNSSRYNKLLQNSGTVARVGSSPNYKYYKLSVTGRTVALTNNLTTSLSQTQFTLYQMLQDAFDRHLFVGAEWNFPDDAKVSYNGSYYQAQWIDISDELTASIPATVPLAPSAPYYMFVMPYHDASFSDGTVKTAKGAYSIPFVQSLIKAVGTHVLDVQLLPYFPDQYHINAGTVLLNELDSTTVTYLKDGDGNNISFIYWGAPQTFRANLTYNIPALPSAKIDNETRFCRLNAPNYSASFDFSIAKNRGVSFFHAVCTYRPYQPHIQIIPEWGGVYGQYFPDGRGLICGGDYSVDIVNDQWTQYQINNKNYQLIFDRQIQTMDLQHDVQRMNEKFQAAAGVMSAAASGSMAGAAGGIPGMLAGGLISWITSAIGGAMDIYNNQRLRTDQRSAAFDMFGYNLGNIQARPTTITKLSALVGNNKIWPFYEIYSATSREIAALNLQIQYSGVTVGAVGTVNTYLGGPNSFIRGRLIRITGLEHDAEMSQLVADELARGIYMT